MAASIQKTFGEACAGSASGGAAGSRPLRTAAAARRRPSAGARARQARLRQLADDLGRRRDQLEHLRAAAASRSACRPQHSKPWRGAGSCVGAPLRCAPARRGAFGVAAASGRARLGRRACRASQPATPRAPRRSPPPSLSRACAPRRPFCSSPRSGALARRGCCSRSRRAACRCRSRAAARRALERCGRVRGRLASTPLPFARRAVDVLAALDVVHRHIIA